MPLQFADPAASWYPGRRQAGESSRASVKARDDGTVYQCTASIRHAVTPTVGGRIAACTCCITPLATGGRAAVRCSYVLDRVSKYTMPCFWQQRAYLCSEEAGRQAGRQRVFQCRSLGRQDGRQTTWWQCDSGGCELCGQPSGQLCFPAGCRHADARTPPLTDLFCAAVQQHSRAHLWPERQGQNHSGSAALPRLPSLRS